jgi:AcrR family transcriptional regulator
MARARSVEKQQAILQSTVREIAEVGLGASTAKIAKGAGLAEGTIFTYFASKEELFNELYAAIKTDVYVKVNKEFPHSSGLYERAQHIWTRYLRWAWENPLEQKASVLLDLSPVISVETRKRLDEVRGFVPQTMQELGRCGAFRELPPGFASSAMLALQTPILELASRKPREAQKLIQKTFDAFWRLAE